MSSAIATAPIEGTVLCGQREASCYCEEPNGHITPHVCECGGSWHYDEAGEFCIDAWPVASRRLA